MNALEAAFQEFLRQAFPPGHVPQQGSEHYRQLRVTFYRGALQAASMDRVEVMASGSLFVEEIKRSAARERLVH
jgi:hypothetical protein